MPITKTTVPAYKASDGSVHKTLLEAISQERTVLVERLLREHLYNGMPTDHVVNIIVRELGRLAEIHNSIEQDVKVLQSYRKPE